MRDAPNEEVEEAIRPGGISKVKSRRIQAILRALPEPLDGPHLEDREFLLSLPGVGRKTAACVLLFAYGQRDDPGRHARLARGHPPRAVPAEGARSRRCTTRCSPSHRAGRSSSCT